MKDMIIKVFSTYVEVFLKSVCERYDYKSLLHVRGGVSDAYVEVAHKDGSSPRTWRCFYHIQRIATHVLVFSTYVEVFPTRRNSTRGDLGVFSTYVEVFPVL